MEKEVNGMNTNFADTVILCIEIIGTIAFASSGAMTGVTTAWELDYTGEGIVVDTIVDPILYGRLKDFITKEMK